MKKLPIFPTLFLLFLSTFVFGQKPLTLSYAASDIPEELTKNAHSVIRYEKVTYTVTNLNNAQTYYHAVITLLNKKSPYSDIGVFYDKIFDKASLFNIKIYDASGKLIKKIKDKDVSDHSNYSREMFDDSRYKYADVSNPDYPYTIEYEYTKQTQMTMFYPDWYIIKRFEVSVQQSDFEIVTPEDIEVRHRTQNIDVPLSKKTENKLNYYTSSVTNIPAMVDEPVSPSEERIMPCVFFAPNKFAIGDYKGDMSSWEDLGKFSYDLNKDRDVLSEEMAKKVKELITDVSTKEEKIKILYHYLQENMRYVSIQLGIGGWQTFDAKYVERNKYGDCKALTNFMKSMLKSADIEAYAALIRNGDDAYDQSLEFSSSDFNHVILYVPNGDDDGMWLECTSSDLPAGTIGASNENRYALIVKPEGSKLLRTPCSTKDENVLLSNISINLMKDGTANIKANQKAKGHQDNKYRYYALNESDDEIQKVLRNSFSLPSFKIKSYALVPNKEVQETSITLDLEVPKYVSQGGKRMFVSPNPLNQLTYVPREVSDRKLPIENTYAFSDVDVVTIDIPEGYEVESIPQDNLLIDNDFGKYSIKFEQKDNQLIYTRTMERKRFSYPKERYDEYRDFLKEISKADQMKIVLVRNQP